MWDSVAGVSITIINQGTIQATIWSIVALWSLYAAATTFDLI
jgi:hypothetical protein